MITFGDVYIDAAYEHFGIDRSKLYVRAAKIGGYRLTNPLRANNDIDQMVALLASITSVPLPAKVQQNPLTLPDLCVGATQAFHTKPARVILCCDTAPWAKKDILDLTIKDITAIKEIPTIGDQTVSRILALRVVFEMTKRFTVRPKAKPTLHIVSEKPIRVAGVIGSKAANAAFAEASELFGGVASRMDRPEFRADLQKLFRKHPNT